jgi:hypothetical protein
MICPIFRGETDQHKLLFESRCEKHLAEVLPPTEEEMNEALEEGRRHAQEFIYWYTMRGWRL